MEDHEGIIQLCKEINLYEKWDFMTGLWLKFTKHADTIMAVAEKEGKIVGCYDNMNLINVVD